MRMIIPWAVRMAVLKRDGLKCRYCGAPLDFFNQTIDHVLPRSHGGTEEVDNLVMCCFDCNRRAKNDKFESFEAKKQHLVIKAEQAHISRAASLKERLRRAQLDQNK